MSSTHKKILIAILLISAILRFGGLSRGDAINDEVFYGFRAIGPMDFDQAELQTTPLEWSDPNIPAWTNLSFHDHPPLVFWIQHLSIKIFGENNVAMRLPSAILGIASIYLIFLLGTLLYSTTAGLIAAGLLSVTVNHVYISRVGMQESYVIFFLLVCLYLFLKATEVSPHIKTKKNDLTPHKNNYFILTGIALGLAFLTKYNAVILIPIFGTYLLLYRREQLGDYIKNKQAWIGVVLAIVIFSPVIIYNTMLYRAVGHFDFQFSYIFGQHPEVWSVAPGKDIGTITERIKNFTPYLIATNSWLFLSLVCVSLAYGLYRLGKNFHAFRHAVLPDQHSHLSKNQFEIIPISIMFLLMLLLVIGPAYRFLTLLAPFFALIIGASVAHLFANKTKLLIGLCIPLILFELWYSYNNQIAYYPIGQEPWLASKVRHQNYNWGNNELTAFFEKEFEKKIPAITFDMKYTFLEKMQNRFIERDTARGFTPYPALVVTDGNFDHGAKLWGLDRLHIYHGWPIITLATYLEYLNKEGFDFYDRVGFKTFYFVTSSNIVPDKSFTLLTKDLVTIPIKAPNGDTPFTVYVRNISNKVY